MIEKIKKDMIIAMKEKNKKKLSTIRLLISSIKNEEIAKGRSLASEEIIGVIKKEVKQLKKALEDFEKGKREDLVEKTEEEIFTLEQYLPPQLSDEEIESVVLEILSEIPDGEQKEGLIMKKLMPLLKGKADGKRVQHIVKQVTKV